MNNLNSAIQIRQTNQKAVLSSAIVAKATVLNNGRINILVAFQLSTRIEFYWVFQAKSARTPRRAWKYLCTFGRDSGMANFKPYADFGSFVEHYAKSKKAEVLNVRVLHSRRMATMLAKTHHESISSNWQPVDMTNAKFDKLNKSYRAHLRGHEWWK